MENANAATDIPTSSNVAPVFPADLIGKKVVLATESHGPVNGVSRTTQSLVDYLRHHGVNVAVCAPHYKGAALNSIEPKVERTPIINQAWIRSIEAKSSSLAKRGIGGAWQWHNSDHSQPAQTQSALPGARTPLLTPSRSDDAQRKLESPNAKRCQDNPEFRLRGRPLPYNPDLTIAYPFRLTVVYKKTFKPDIIYLASPASVGFQFLVQLGQLHAPPPTLLNFQTDLSAYSGILFRPPLDRYAKFLLQMVQGYLFRMSNVHTIFYPCAAVREYLEAA